MQSLDNSPDRDSAEADRLLDQGNALRDQRAWADAAEAYGAYLRLRPADGAIWIQYGHSLKEAGDPQGALLCYREAEKLRPEDSDLQVQIGHALKLLGRAEEAFGAYAMALSLDPGNRDAQRELLGGAAAPEPAEAAALPAAPAPTRLPPATLPAGAALVFDASDLLDYFRANRAPTGIQRVQLNIIREALAAPGAPPVVITAFESATGAWKAVPAELFGRLAALSRSGTATADPAWREATATVEGLLRDGPALDFPPGSTLVNLGTSWWLPEYLRRVREAKARFGLRYIPFLHDCIPLVVPEHCEPKLVDEFARWFAGLCLHADAVLTNSECTRADFERLRRAVMPAHRIPAFAVPLDAAAEPPAAAPLPAGLGDGRPFVLCVGTIESRKNHLLVFQAWLTLLRQHGEAAVPDLVCVGKRGWLAEEALRLHARSPLLQAKVRLLHDVPDTMLEGLYRACLFTLYNSFYEGWGLPVTESLAHGKVALVPDHSGLRESGAPGAVFFAPNSEPELAGHVWWLASDPGHRRALEERIAAQARFRPWSAIAAQVMRDAVSGAASGLPAPLARLALPLGQAHPLRLLPGPDPLPAMAVADALREGPGWSPLEDWGCWARPGESRLRLPLPREADGAALRVYLEVKAPDSACRFGLRAGRDGGPEALQTLETRAGERLFAMLTVPPGGEGDMVIALEHGPGADRIGVCSLMACRADDHSARLDYLESRALARLPGF